MADFCFPVEQSLEALFRKHRGDPAKHGWRVRLRFRFNYFTPDTWYQAVVDQLVFSGCTWVDVGGGKSVFPDNEKLSRELASRAAKLVGVDPSENIEKNEIVSARFRTTIEQFNSLELFDIATLRMVAEHVQQPHEVVDSLARLIKPMGYVVIFTPNKWSIASIAARLIPNSWHAFFARMLSPGRMEEDVFPTCYKMNTQKQLKSVFESNGFSEVGFKYVDDCVILQRFVVRASSCCGYGTYFEK